MTFHQAVNLGRYEQEKVVSFVPPDGEFELMKYRCQDGIQSPFSVLPVIAEHGRTHVEVRMPQGYHLLTRLGRPPLFRHNLAACLTVSVCGVCARRVCDAYALPHVRNSGG